MEGTPILVVDDVGSGPVSSKKEASYDTFGFSDDSIPTAVEDEHDFHFLRNKLSLLEYSLEQQRATSSYLREERDEAITLNTSLRHEVEELRRKVHRKGKSRSSGLPQCKECEVHNTGPLKKGQTVLDCVLGLPRKCVRGLVKRAALFVWWTGVWTNEGLAMLRIENKWVEVQQIKSELEEDNAKLVQQVYDLQKQLTEKEVEVIREIERNKELTNRLIKKCGVSCDRNAHPCEKTAKHIQAVADFSESLGDEIEKIKGVMDRGLSKFEKVYHEVDRLSESQRLLENAERNLDKRLQELADSITHDCPNCNAGSSQAREVTGMDETDKQKAVLLDKASPEITLDSRNEGKSAKAIKLFKRALPSVYGVFFCSCRAVVLFLLTFLVTGVLFHFLLVSSSFRLPSSPADEYYGVDLFALWSYFINWLFYLVVSM